MRLIVEPAAAAMAAEHRTARQLSWLDHAMKPMMIQWLESVEGQAADEPFDVILLKATGNELLGSLLSSISSAVRWTTFFKYRAPAACSDSIPQHQTLFETIACGDPAAARVAATVLIEQARRDTEMALAAS